MLQICKICQGTVPTYLLGCVQCVRLSVCRLAAPSRWKVYWDLRYWPPLSMATPTSLESGVLVDGTGTQT